MEDFIEKYSKWFPYCEKEKLKEQMKHDLSAMAEPTNENSGLHLQRVSGSNCCKQCGKEIDKPFRFCSSECKEYYYR